MVEITLAVIAGARCQPALSNGFADRIVAIFRLLSRPDKIFSCYIYNSESRKYFMGYRPFSSLF